MPEEPEDGLLLDFMEFRHAEAIGNVVVEMSRLEAVLDGAIWIMAGLEDDEEIAACITAQLTGPRQRFDALISLAKFRKTSKSGITKLLKFKEEVIRLAERRNRIVHDTWHYGMDKKQHYQLEVTARSELRFMYKPVSETDLAKLKDDIIAARGRFSEVFRPARATVHTWLDKPE